MCLAACFIWFLALAFPVGSVLSVYGIEEGTLAVKAFPFIAWLMTCCADVSRLSTLALQFYATLNALYAAFCGERSSLPHCLSIHIGHVHRHLCWQH